MTLVSRTMRGLSPVVMDDLHDVILGQSAWIDAAIELMQGIRKTRRLYLRALCLRALDLATQSQHSADENTGILHSRFHELWSLRSGTSLEDRPRYTPTTCFETFPFPAGLTPRDTAHQRTEVLADPAVIPAGVAVHGSKDRKSVV